MFAARVRASLRPLFHGRINSSLSRNGEAAAISKRNIHDRFNSGERSVSSLRLPGNGVGITLFHRAFHSSPQCYSSETDVGVKTRTLEDDLFSELGSVEKDKNQNAVVELLTKMPEPLQVEKRELPQKSKGRKKHKKAADSISKPKLLTEKPEVSWKANCERKAEAHASSPARNVTDSNVIFSKPSKSSSPIRDHTSNAQNIISPSSEAENETSSEGSSTSSSQVNHLSSAFVVRIGNLNSKTVDSMIQSRCLSIGALEGLARVNEDTVDVLFRPRNLKEADSILEKLNNATLDHSQWTAEIVPEAEEACRDEMGMRITSCFEGLEKQLATRRILAKDLEVLLHSVMHLENHPMAREGTRA